MAVNAGLVAPITHEDDVVARNASLGGRIACRLEERLLSDNDPGARVFKLARKLVDRVGRVRGAGDAGRPVQAEVDNGGVGVVGGEEGEDIALLPLEDVPQAPAEGDGMGLDVREGVGAVGVAIDEESCALGQYQ